MFARVNRILPALVVLGILVGGPATAESAQPIELTIKDHRFQPDRIEVAADQAFVLLVRNQDPTPEEFESRDLHREKVIAAGGEARIRIGALKPGEYRFVASSTRPPPRA